MKKNIQIIKELPIACFFSSIVELLLLADTSSKPNFLRDSKPNITVLSITQKRYIGGGKLMSDTDKLL